MSELYRFICTRTSYPPVLPAFTGNQAAFNYDVALGFEALAAGFDRCGDVIARAVPTAIPNHLLCDGSTVNREDFPELADVLGVSEAATTFQLPDYTTAEPALPADPPTQTVEGGTVSTGGAVSTPTEPGQAGGSTGGNIPSGGRYRLDTR